MDRSKLHLKMPKQTMRRKLFLYTFAMAILLLALLATMLILLGRFRTPKDELFEKSDMQAQVFERDSDAQKYSRHDGRTSFGGRIADHRTLPFGT